MFHCHLKLVDHSTFFSQVKKQKFINLLKAIHLFYAFSDMKLNLKTHVLSNINLQEWKPFFFFIFYWLWSVRLACEISWINFYMKLYSIDLLESNLREGREETSPQEESLYGRRKVYLEKKKRKLTFLEKGDLLLYYLFCLAFLHILCLYIRILLCC